MSKKPVWFMGWFVVCGFVWLSLLILAYQSAEDSTGTIISNSLNAGHYVEVAPEDSDLLFSASAKTFFLLRNYEGETIYGIPVGNAGEKYIPLFEVKNHPMKGGIWNVEWGKDISSIINSEQEITLQYALTRDTINRRWTGWSLIMGLILIVGWIVILLFPFEVFLPKRSK